MDQDSEQEATQQPRAGEVTRSLRAPPDGPLPVVTGTLLGGRYRLVDLLGRGGMSAVYLADDVEAGRHVAIKILHKSAPTGKQLERFGREARLAAQVDRTGGVVRVHDFGLHGQLPYLVLERVEGQDLDQRIRADGPLDPRWIAGVIRSLAETLAAVHEAGVLHRDIKPGNILLPSDGTRPKLTDFGLARSSASERLTVTGAFLGTPAYMSPEQYRAASDVDARADIYSLGATFYHGLTGHTPSGDDRTTLFAQLGGSAIPAPSTHRADIPAELEAVCLKALAYEPAERYATAAELAADLERFLRGETVTAGSQSAWSRLRAGVRRRDPVALLIALAPLPLAAVSLGLWTQFGAPSSAVSTLDRHAAWVRAELEPWALGFGAGPAPTSESLVVRRRQLENAVEHLTPEAAERARDALATLRAHERLVAHSRGAPVPPAEACTTEDVVDALLATSPRKLRASLSRLRERTEPAALKRARPRLWEKLIKLNPDPQTFAAFADYVTRVDPAERPHAQAVLPGAIGAWYSSLIERALSSAKAALGAEIQRLNEVVAVAEAPGAVLDAKVQALEAGVAAWREPLESAAKAPTERKLLDLLGRLGAVAQGEPPARAGPRLSELADRVQAMSLETSPDLARKGTLASLRQAARVDAALCYGLDPARRTSPRLAERVRKRIDSVIKFNDTHPLDLEVVLAQLRAERSETLPETAESLARFVSAADVAAMTLRRPKSSAVALLATCQAIRESRRGWALEDFLAREAMFEVIFAGRLPDLAPHYVGEAHALCSEFTYERLARIPPAPGADTASFERALRHTRLARPDLVGFPKHVHTFRTEARLLTAQADFEGALRAWEQAVKAYEGAKPETALGVQADRVQNVLVFACSDLAEALDADGAPAELLVTALERYARRGLAIATDRKHRQEFTDHVSRALARKAKLADPPR